MAATDQDLSPAAPAARSRRTGALAGGIIVFAALAAYGNSFQIPFLFDDAGSITNNQSIRSLWPIWRVLKPLPGGLPVSGRPMLNLSFALNYAISGFDVWSYHVFNLAIHILAGLTLFAIVRRTIARKAGNSLGRTVGSIGAEPALFALAVALIWTLHPLQTEAVDYISQRAESLMGLFYLLTLYFFIRGADSEMERLAPKPLFDSAPGRNSDPTAWGQAVPPRKFLLLSIFFCLLGMATKEVMVSAPLIVFLYDRTFVAGTFGNAWRLRRKYYLGLAFTWLVLIRLVLGTGTRGGTAGFGIDVTPWAYALIQFQAIAHYLRLALWPHPLVFYYDRPVGVAAATVGLDAAIVVSLAGATIYGLFRRVGHGLGGGRLPGFAGACFFAILAPSSSIVPVATEMMAEHRMYLSLAAVVAAGVGGIYCLAERFAGERSGRFWLFICLAMAIGLGGLTARRNHVYRSDVALWTETVAATPGSSPARNNLGNALLQAGEVRAAIAECTEALRLNPRNAKAHADLANALMKLNRRTEAIGHYEEALRLTPGDADIHNNLGIALAGADRLSEAIRHYEIALRLDPDLAVTYNNLGNALVGQRKFPEAIAEFEQALRLQPGYAGADDNLGAALAAAGRQTEAIGAYERALRLRPDFPEAENHLGIALGLMGRRAEARAHFERALRLNPDFPEAHNNLGNVLLESGKKTEAAAEYREAVGLNADYFEAHCHLGEVLADLGRTAEAAEQFALAERLQPDNAEIHNNRGCLLGALGRTAEAEREFEAALRIDPRDAEARANLELLRNPAKKSEPAPADAPR